MILFVYNMGLLLALLAGAPVWLLRPRGREGLRERLGAGAARVGHALAGRQQVWVHAVSVGEVVAASRLVEELDARLGRGSVAISTTTRTGQQLARERFGAGRCFYFPIDLPWVVRGAFRALRPRVLVLAESELWPNVLAECARQRIPVVVVNARVSDRSLPRYQRLRRWWRPFLEMLTLVLAQSAEDARRFVAIGVPETRVRVGGNLKFDVRPPQSSPVVEQLRARLPQGVKVLVAGSTLEDEERVLLEEWPRICARMPKTVMVLAPRHPERFARVAALAREKKVPLVQRSLWDGSALAAGSVFLLDSIGELGSVYCLATVAFVGGSLVPAGGHNPLEPARFGVPVVMGPHYENFRDAVELLRSADALHVVERASVGEAIASLLANTDGTATMGMRGKKVFEEQAGATQRAVDAVVQLLSEGNA
ncbi:MAG TPA: 3-deoxy-D-manno-octulosonic acid transferase [Acidobacteriaceae bacterium]|nr:3-deoxy-D-manno-octulosonic acid transferase [Acidobacteriaceae bacterium]